MTEHRKLAAVQDRVDAVLGFMQYLAANGWAPTELTITADFVYQWFDIDPAALEAEREEAVRYVLDH
jgi:hypothetical protein